MISRALQHRLSSCLSTAVHQIPPHDSLLCVPRDEEQTLSCPRAVATLFLGQSASPSALSWVLPTHWGLSVIGVAWQADIKHSLLFCPSHLTCAALITSLNYLPACCVLFTFIFWLFKLISFQTYRNFAKAVERALVYLVSTKVNILQRYIVQWSKPGNEHRSHVRMSLQILCRFHQLSQ